MGAVAALIVDANTKDQPHAVTGHVYRCQEYNQQCIPGATKKLGEGFAAEDMPTLW